MDRKQALQELIESYGSCANDNGLSDITIGTDELIDLWIAAKSKQAEIEQLRKALEPLAYLEWIEEYTQPTPNVRTYVSRGAIEHARFVLGIKQDT